LAIFSFSIETICVVTSDGRVITGELVGNDQVQNLILNQAQERVYADDTPVETVELGLYVIRGDNVCMIGEFDPEKWDDSAVIPPLPPIQQQKL
jgi:U6 snRNA-associated Sm-like protein LSm8